MKKLSWQCGLLAVAALTLITGCRKKKEPTVTPQAQAPAITAPAPPAQSAPQPTTTGPAPAPASSTAAPQPSAPVKTTKKKKRKPRTQVAKKTIPTEAQSAPSTTAATGATTTPSTATPPATAPGAAVTPATATTPSGTSTAGGQPAADAGTVGISAAVDHSQEARQQEMTQQLLSSTDANLKSINRPLTADERAMIDEIRNYMAQSRAAITDGDFTRANNLATKAHLLSDELVKH
jgi:outer membrane biosynthesis protein TonB